MSAPVSGGERAVFAENVKAHDPARRYDCLVTSQEAVMLRAMITTALVAGALAKGVAIGVALTTAGAACARCACRARRRAAEPEAGDAETAET